jgi:hypothetical protein
MTKQAYVLVQVNLDDSVDPDEVISNVDYKFDYDGIQDTRIVEVCIDAIHPYIAS